MSGLVLITPPDKEVITVSEAKDQASICGDGDNDLIDGMIKGATRFLETLLHRSFVETEWELVMDNFPGDDHFRHSGVSHFTGSSINRGQFPSVSRFNHRAIRPYMSDLISVTSLKYLDVDNVEQTLFLNTDYIVDIASKPGRVTEAFDKTWPDTIDVMNSVRLRFKAGYGASPDDVPADIKLMIKGLVAYYYVYREPFITGMTVSRLPMYLQEMIGANKVIDFA